MGSSLLRFADVGLKRWEKSHSPPRLFPIIVLPGLRTLVRNRAQLRDQNFHTLPAWRGEQIVGHWKPPSQVPPSVVHGHSSCVPPASPLGVGTSAAVLCPELSESLSSQTPFFFAVEDFISPSTGLLSLTGRLG